MSLHEKYGLTRVVNAAGTYTPLGVSRSSPKVGQAAFEALTDFFVMDELQDAASAAIARWTGAEAGTVTHCAAAGITLAVAASMAGKAAGKVAALPDAAGMPARVILPAGHAVDYGHPILQDIRLTGATLVLAGSDEIADALARKGTACLLLVSSRLVSGKPVGLAEAVAAAHARGLPAIIDGAAQDRRIPELLATGADLVIVSGHKYLASPTAGLVIGRRAMVEAVRAHGNGIGRAMKPTKEAVLGLLAAIEEREADDPEVWREMQSAKVSRLIDRLNGLSGLLAVSMVDPAGMPFSRVEIAVDPAASGFDAATLAARLKFGDPSVRVMEHALAHGRIVLELVPLTDPEIDLVIERIEEALKDEARSRRSNAGTSP